MKLTLVNHACVKIETAAISILCDPWIEGSAFNMGWDLLVPTPLSFDEIMTGVTHVWISHEHPDHFAPPFLSRLAKSEYGNKITVLFQKTRDHRVVNYCNSIGLKTQELDNRVATKLTDEVSVTCGVVDFYDSWLFISDGRNSILNFNDCHTRNDKVAAEIANSIPRPTVLLSQFSYASWKGSKENSHYRAQAAAQKLETLARQTRLLNPVYTVPYASMIYFSNEENNYLNDHVNTPQKAAVKIEETGSRAAVLYPGDTWDINQGAWNSKTALERYASLYNQIETLPRRSAGVSSDIVELKSAFDVYQKRIYSKNSRVLINMLSRLPILNIFQPLIIELYDINTLVSMSVVDGLAVCTKPCQPDVRMHSSSLLFLLKNEFGFDTLMVNGRFETSTSGFSKMTKSLAVGSLNAMGMSLSLSLLSDLRVIMLLLQILSGVLIRLRQSKDAGLKATASTGSNQTRELETATRS